MKVVFMKKGIIFGLLMLILGACEVRAEEAAENLLMVSEDEISEAIKKEFVEQGRPEAVDLEFFGGQTVFQIENARKAKILVEKEPTNSRTSFPARWKFLPTEKPLHGLPFPGNIMFWEKFMFPPAILTRES